jgi:peptide/nickel transport system substrate-binding protein
LTFKFSPPVVTGPYIPIANTATYNIYERRDDWWATEAYGIRPGPKYIEQLYVPSAEDQIAMALATNILDTGAGTSYMLGRAAFEALRAKNPYVRDWSLIAPYGWQDSGARYLAINNEKYPWGIPEVRKAMQYYINRTSIVQVALEGASVANWAWWPQYAGVMQYINNVTDLKQKYESDICNPNKGDAILTGLGWKKGADGIWVTDNGTRATFDILTYPTLDYQKIGMQLTQQLNTVGIETTQTMLATSTVLSRIQVGDFEGLVMYIPFGDTDPYADLVLLHSRNYVPLGKVVGAGVKGNFMRYKNPEYDKLIEQLEAT